MPCAFRKELGGRYPRTYCAKRHVAGTVDKGEREGVWDAVRTALDKFAKASVVDYSAYLIDLHLAEIVFMALEQGAKGRTSASADG